MTSLADAATDLRRARDLIDREFADDALRLDRIAAAAYMSKSHFVRRFSAQFGTTPAAYLSRRRIERAQDLLRFANLRITEICHAVGFRSLGSFSATFTEQVGVTPSEYQRRWRSRGHPRVPGCEVLMWGMQRCDTPDVGATGEKH